VDALDRELVRVAVAAMDAHRSEAAVDWRLGGEELGHSGISAAALALVVGARRVLDERPHRLDAATGRKSGERFVFPLFYGKAGDRYFVIASKGGAPRHPGWYRDILADPYVEVQVGNAKMKARARTASGEERARLWEKAMEFWPPYADYQRRTEREIPVVVLDPVR
jgi:proline iminopeptidase